MASLPTLIPVLPELSQSLWERYGFRGNPFNTHALSASAESILPIAQAIVGRGMESPESQLLTNFLRNPGGGRVIVEGDVGVGKTTFVNYHRYLWENEAKDKLLTPINEISVYGNWEVRDFLLNILGSIINKWEVLRIAVKLEAFTNTDIAAALGQRRQNVTKYLNTLLTKNFIYPHRREGRHILYRVSEDVRIIRDVPENEQAALF